MAELEKAVRNWRERQQRKSSLSPRELDELEDHLRGRVALELEANVTLAPHMAFVIALEALGDPALLSREFAKAGRPRRHRLLVAGWAMFALSFFLPVSYGFALPWSEPEVLWGWQALVSALNHAENPIQLLSALSNVPMLVTLAVLHGTWSGRVRWLTPLVAGSAALNLYWPMLFISDGANPFVDLGVGYWVWGASFGCVATALWRRARNWEPAQPERVRLS